MGGHRGAREAALTACEQLSGVYYSPDFEISFTEPEAVKSVMQSLFEETNIRMEKDGKENPAYMGWGCAVSALVIRGQYYYFAHVGDTRIYRFRHDVSELLTEDQNLAFQMYRHEKVSYKEYLTGMGHSMLMSYMGQGENISVETGYGDILNGDIFLLCSDGLNQFAEFRDMDPLIMKISSKPGDRLSLMHTAFTEHIIRVEEAKDNVTFMLVGIESN